jgi:hypothetical protein
MSTYAQIAADWWADQIGNPSRGTGTGDGMLDASQEWGRSHMPNPTQSQVETFRAALRELIDERIVGHDSWTEAVEKGEPRWGASFRVFGTDYGPDPILADALARAGIHAGALSPLPVKTRMWVNPGRVVVAHGYGAAREVVYDENAPNVSGVRRWAAAERTAKRTTR